MPREDREMTERRNGDPLVSVDSGDERTADMRVLLWLLGVGVVGTVCANMESLTDRVMRDSAPLVVTLVLMEIAITLVAVVVGLAVAKSTGLGANDVRACFAREPEACRRLARASAVTTTIVTVVVLFLFGLLAWLDAEGSKRLALELSEQSAWIRLLKSLGAGIREETWFRLGLMGAAAWLVARVLRTPVGRGPIAFGIVVSSLAFAVMHVPDLWPGSVTLETLLPTIQAHYPKLVATFVAGVVLALIYRRRGFVSAVAAHASIDVVALVIGPAAFI